MSLVRGTLVLVELHPTLGHAQRGIRRCVVVSDGAVNRNQRFPRIAVVPVTGTAATGALCPALAPGPSGLSKPSTALVDQLRSIDKRRI
jgi:mRNA interferase MazF